MSEDYMQEEIIKLNEKLNAKDNHIASLKHENYTKDQKIADLEAKLVESDGCAGMLHHHLTDKAIEIEMLGEEIDELKQQLAEKNADLHQIYSHLGVEAFGEDIQEMALKAIANKDKEIERWNNNYKQRDRQFQSVRQRYHLLNRLQAKYDDRHKLHLSEMQCLELVKENEKLHQDKISFAVEQLEKVKWFIEDVDYAYGDEDFINRADTMEFVDNQIKQLKEMK